ncbi:hypothetical protein JTE90_029678 [Oedothorax gibbosus]|uniref:Uncharacterized protein n=1 Tax=Oedothorax gibbosus TaxID=931172 RepID=A0AAV6U059_9ARAC|nr:hypothetical protein JTE90_029678 [Oedothorax gibbosus]
MQPITQHRNSGRGIESNGTRFPLNTGCYASNYCKRIMNLQVVDRALFSHGDTPKRRKSLPTYTQHSSTSMQVLHDLYSRLASSPAPQPTLDSGGPAVILAPSLPASELPKSGLRALCSLLDPPDSMGRDWCMLGILLGLTEKLPQMDPGFRNLDRKQEYR